MRNRINAAAEADTAPAAVAVFPEGRALLLLRAAGRNRNRRAFIQMSDPVLFQKSIKGLRLLVLRVGVTVTEQFPMQKLQP